MQKVSDGMMIDLPNRLKTLLEKQDSLNAAVFGTLATVSPLVASSSLPFFPDYTEHGIDHLRSVLRTADALIPDSCRQELTAADAATLILAVLLHDLGMHLTESGFLALIAPKSAAGVNPLVPQLDTLGWPELWEDFIASAKRFDGKSLNRLFGDTDPIRRPPPDPEQWTKRDRKLIGEFVRRHHARLAHEIATTGFPASPNALPVIDSHLQPDLADLAGLVARSHGVPLRACLQILQERFHLCEYQGVHAVYLMVLVRIADYLQVQSERAPAERFCVNDIKSPKSQVEWRAHRAIKNITFEGPDPEALDIKAIPSDVRTFLRLRDLLEGLQEELDVSWAVLGEVYGRHDRLSRLGLELRRVRSNLDDVGTLAGAVPYIPERARFESVDAELLSLLVRPLYGEDVNIAVRELIQNAVDACRELKEYCEHSGTELPESVHGEPDVTIVLTGDDTNGHRLTVTDRGIGMTADVVRNYFLRAGASYRRSDAWRRIFDTKAGKSRVLRSGRFGIGVLASFLLGEEIEVTTRHVTSPEEGGIRFRASLDMDVIELEHCRAAVGTTVSITLQAKSAKALKKIRSNPHLRRFGELPDGLYLLSWPKVEICLVRPYRPTAWPAAGDALRAKWHRLHVGDFEDVHWSYEGVGFVRDPGMLACNGIPVGYMYGLSHLWEQDAGFGLEIPTVSVFDSDGRFPLVLTRTKVATPRLPFQSELIADICRDIVAYCLIDEAPHGWRTQVGKENSVSIPACTHPGLGKMWSTKGLPPYMVTSDGFAFQHEEILQMLNVNFMVVVTKGVPCRLPRSNWAVTEEGQAVGHGRCDKFARSYAIDRQGAFASAMTSDVRVRVSEKVSRRWPNNVMSNAALRMLPERSEGGFATEGFVPFGFDFAPPNGSAWAVAECALGASSSRKQEPSPLIKAFTEHLGTCIIPFDPAERRARFGRAFAELKDYIDRHEALKKGKSARARPHNPEGAKADEPNLKG